MNKKSITSDNLTNTSSDFGELLSYIKKSHQNVFKLINTTLIDLYWELGKRLSKKIDQEGWGRGTIVQFARYLSLKAPEIKGFSDKNLWRTKQFYETYHDNEKLASLVRELSWTHNTIIFSRCKTIEERQFYLELSKKESYSKRELERQISASLFERTMVGTSKLSPLVRELQPRAEEVFKDNYVLEFLGLPKIYNEANLQKEILKKMKDFILELGKDFLFIGEEYKIQVGSQDFFIDLLFYHRGLQCLVAFELKADKFKPEHTGQLNFYLEALDRDVKKPHENPSIGILLCRDKDDEVVEYALSRNLSPAMVAQYQLQLPDKKLIKAKLHEILSQRKELGDE